MSCRGGPWVHSSSFNFQFVHRFWAAEEDMDCLCLFLEFSQIRSGIWQVPYQTPATKDGRGDVHLCPADVTNGADQARWVIITAHQLVVLGAETPQVAVLAKVLWGGMVEMILYLVV